MRGVLGTARSTVSLKLIFRSPKLAPRWTLSAAVSGTPKSTPALGRRTTRRQNELHFHLRRNTPTYLPCGCLFSSVDRGIVPPGRLEGSHGSVAFEDQVK